MPIDLLGIQTKLAKRKASTTETGYASKKSKDKHRDRVIIVPLQPPTPLIRLEALRTSGRPPTQQGSSSALGVIFHPDRLIYRDDTIMSDIAKAREVRRGLITPRDCAGTPSTYMSELLDLFLEVRLMVSLLSFFLFYSFVGVFSLPCIY